MARGREEVTLFRFILLRHGGARLSVIDGGTWKGRELRSVKTCLLLAVVDDTELSLSENSWPSFVVSNSFLIFRDLSLIFFALLILLPYKSCRDDLHFARTLRHRRSYVDDG